MDMTAVGLNEIEHYFAGNVYAKLMRLDAGQVAGKHVHEFDHLSVLMRGRVILRTSCTSLVYDAPAVVTIEAGVEHQIEAISDTLWLCVHEVTHAV